MRKWSWKQHAFARLIIGLRNTARLTFFVALGFLLTTPAQAEQWPIKKFEVKEVLYSRATELGPLQVPENLHLENYLTDEQEEAIEKWLEEIADHFESMGFRPPRYEKLTADGSAYEVQIFPFEGAARALSDCDNRELDTVIQINPLSNSNFRNGELLPQGYQDLAHELFHVVQAAYPDQCNWGNWVTEGTAQAVGVEIARKYRNIEPMNFCQIGLRKYSRSLYTDDLQGLGDFPCEGSPGRLNYAALSFWQFLGEKRARHNANQMMAPPEQFFPPDYRYLHNFFNTPHPGRSNAASYDWLEKSLGRAVRRGQHQFGISVHTAYSEFVGTFATYWKEDRLSLYPGTSSGNPGEKQEQWMEWVFGGCEEVALYENASTSVSLGIDPVAARCVKVTFPDAPVAQQVNLAISAAGQNLDVESLAVSTVGAAGGDQIKILRRAGHEPEGRLGVFSEIWAEAGSPQYFVVSNVLRKNADNTIPVNVALSILPEVTSTSMAETRSTPVPEDATAEEEVEAALESFSWFGTADQNDRSPCTDRPFEASPCGSVTRLDLKLVSDSAKLMREAAQPSMFMRQSGADSIFNAMQQDPEGLANALGESARQIKQQDGHTIRITIPRISPGFTGTVGNAHMRVAKAQRADARYRPRDYEAVGPEWVDTRTGYDGRCIGGYLPSSGEVTITEFTKNSLVGTFSAGLVDPENDLEPCQPAAIARNISGEFSISIIDFGDSRGDPEISREQIMDQAIQYTNEANPGLITEELREHLEREMRESPGPGRGDTAGANESIMSRCECNCQMETQLCATTPEAECCSSCQPVFDICHGDPRNLSGELTQQERAQQAQEIREMRQRWEAYVDSLGLPASARTQLINSFDEAETIEMKRLMMMAVPEDI